MTDDILFCSRCRSDNALHYAASRAGMRCCSPSSVSLRSGGKMRFRVNDYAAQNDCIVVVVDVFFCHRKSGKVRPFPRADIERLRASKFCGFFKLPDAAAAVAASLSGRVELAVVGKLPARFNKRTAGGIGPLRATQCTYHDVEFEACAQRGGGKFDYKSKCL